ncbi:kinase-like protein [Basidiobolus meristosporus CBS 931.73]|uniref:Kinase-like protein n=1 Tax=Basidiobolus meristosporus CBS 931.73 TaxID=1314790 RepID=A0A1Y1WTD0_9FUNG|nr:kinase-like protein [Basidiobolus meristosporus CBS 931.73]|eukprot:ORX76783.1 kinase-like protein [Basidiobolus meristosporus CBS 931.73]
MVLVRLQSTDPSKGVPIPFHKVDLMDVSHVEPFSDFSSSSSSSTETLSGSPIPPRFVFKAPKPSPQKKSRPAKKEACHRGTLCEIPLLAALKKRKSNLSFKELYGNITNAFCMGSGGEVYMATSPKTGKKYAIKSFRPRFSYETPAEYCMNISNEIYIAASLDHENIVRTVDVLEENGKIYEVMEYCPRDLFSVFETSNPTESEVNKYFVELVHGIAHLHSRGIAHRDLKLENVCIGEDGHLKIIDFGFATNFYSPYHLEYIPASGVIGSSTFIAPEVWTAESYDPSKDDIWALGVLYICMLTRLFPWEKATADDKNFALFMNSWDSVPYSRNAQPRRSPCLSECSRSTPASVLVSKTSCKILGFNRLRPKSRATEIQRPT